MADEVVNISIAADIKALEQQLAKMPAVGDREAKKLVGALTRQYERAEKAAKASAQRSASEWERNLQKVQGVTEKSLGRMGGLFGTFGDVVFDVVGPLGEVSLGLGAIGAVAGQVQLTVGAVSMLAGGAVQLAAAADAAGDRLAKLGIEVGPEAERDLMAYDQAMADLSVKLDELTVRAGSSTAGELAVLARAFVDNADAAFDTGLALNEFGDDLVTRFLPPVALLRDAIRFGEQSAYAAFTDTSRATLDATVQVRAFAEAARDASVEAAKLNNAEQAFPEFGPLPSQGGPDTARLAREAAERRQDAADAARAEDDATKALVSDLMTVVAYDKERARLGTEESQRAIDQLAIEREAFETTSDNLAVTREIMTIQQDLVEATDAYAGSWEQVGDVIGQVFASINDEVEALGGAVSGLVSLIETVSEATIQRLEDQGDQQIANANAEALAQKRKDEAEVYSQQLAGDLDEETTAAALYNIERKYEAQLEANEALNDDELRLAREQFKRAQQAERAEAIMAAAVSGIALIAGFAYLGPFAAIAAGGEVGFALAEALVAINSQSPPEFPMGLSPDHFPVVGVQRSEAVVNGRGVAVGEDAGIDFDAMNRGVRPGGGRVTVVLGRRTLADAVYDVRREARVHVDRRRGKRDGHHGGRR